jgi:Glycosyl transferase family 2
MLKRQITERELAAFRPPEYNRRPSAIITIPARNEAGRIERCLAAIAVQRTSCGLPVQDAFEVLVFANNCTDATVEIVRRVASRLPFPLNVIERTLSEHDATAGGARRTVMDEAAHRLDVRQGEGVILTTDADSTVSPTWFTDNMRHLEEGADCVAGYIDAEPLEIVGLGSAFLSRGRLEDTYLSQVAEIYARCDPRPHDPWPNHRVSSGASLAVRLSAYRAVGGLPPRALGEDIAFTDLLDRNGFKVRHALDVSVVTSCRLDGRANGGAADTMRYRRDVADAECDDDLEPALQTLRKAVMRGFLRKAWQEQSFEQAARRLSCRPGAMPGPQMQFSDVWEELCRHHPALKRGRPLRPSELPRQIATARLILHHLRLIAGSSAQADRRHYSKRLEPAVSG